jgi:hypothetical protein
VDGRFCQSWNLKFKKRGKKSGMAVIDDCILGYVIEVQGSEPNQPTLKPNQPTNQPTTLQVLWLVWE